MFAYCGNNPIARSDNGGQLWHLAVGAAVGIATQYISDVVTNLSNGKSFRESLTPTSTIADYASAAISGALAASGAGLGISVAANAALGGATYLANCSIAGVDADITDFQIAVGIGAISGLVGGSGADGAKMRGIVSTSNQTLQSAISPKKVAMYTAKIVNVAKNVAVSTARTMAAGFSSNYLNSKRKLITASMV